MRKNWIWIGAFFICACYMYGSLICGWNFLWFDAIDHAAVKLQLLWNHELGLWDPYSHCGNPISGDVAYGLFYPVHVLILILGWFFKSDNFCAINIAIFIETIIGGAGIFLLGGRFGLRGISAFSSAGIFVFSLPVVARVLQYSHYTEIVLIPWFILGLINIKTTEINDKIIWVGMSFIWACVLLGSNPQYSYFMFMVAIICCVVDMVFVWIESHNISKALLLSSKYLIVCVIGTGLAAIDIIPKIEYLGLVSNRGVSIETTPLKYLITYLAPDWFGTVSGTNVKYFSGGFWNYHEFSMYTGISASILATLGLLNMPKNRVWWILVAIFSFGLIYAFTDISWCIPFGKMLRLPGKFLVFNSFVISLFAGWTVANINTIKTYTNRVVPCVSVISNVLFIILLLGVYGETQSAMITWNIIKFGSVGLLTCVLLTLKGNYKYLVVVVAVAELMIYTRPFNLSNNNPAERYQEIPIVGVWKQQARQEGEFRVNLAPLDGSLYGAWNKIFTLQGNLVSLLKNNSGIRSLEKERMFDLLNVKYDIVGESCNVRTTQLPRVYAVRKAIICTNILVELNKKSFDIHNTILVDSGTKLIRTYTNYFDLLMVEQTATNILNIFNNDDFEYVTSIKSNFTWTAKITKYTSDEITIDVELSERGYVVLSETMYPGWEVLVNDKKSIPITANYAFRAVKTPEGKSVIVWRFVPKSMYLGMKISFATTLSIILILMLERRKK